MQNNANRGNSGIYALASDATEIEIAMILAVTITNIKDHAVCGMINLLVLVFAQMKMN